MFRISRLRVPGVLAVIAGGAVLGMGVATGIAVAAPQAVGFGACANSGHRLALENSSGHCPAHFHKVTVGARGPAGPSGVVSMTHYAPNEEPANTTATYEFLGAPPQVTFSSTKTAAEVTATVDEANTTTSRMDENIGVCYEAVGGTTPTVVAHVQPEFTATVESFWAQTVSGVVGNLSPGKYLVGLCADDQTGVSNGDASVTITVAQTSSGVHLDIAKPAAAAHKNQ